TFLSQIRKIKSSVIQQSKCRACHHGGKWAENACIVCRSPRCRTAAVPSSGIEEQYRKKRRKPAPKPAGRKMFPDRTLAAGQPAMRRPDTGSADRGRHCEQRKGQRVVAGQQEYIGTGNRPDRLAGIDIDQ